MTSPITPVPALHLDPTARKSLQDQLLAEERALQKIFSQIIPHLIEQIVKALVPGSTGVVNELTTWGQGIENDISGTWNTLTNAFTGGSSIGHVLSDVEAQFQNFFSNLFGHTTPQAAIQVTAVPPVTRAMSPDMQTITDSINQAINGGVQSGTDPSSLAITLANIPSSNIVPPPDPVSSITEVSTGGGGFSNAEFLGGGAGLNPYQKVTWNEAIASNADFMIIPIVWRTSQARYLNNLSRTVTVGAYGAYSLGTVTVNSGYSYIEFFALRITGSMGLRGTTQAITPQVFDTLAYGGGVMAGIGSVSMSYYGVYRADFLGSATGSSNIASEVVSSVSGRYVISAMTVPGTIGGYTVYSSGTTRYAVSHAMAGWTAIFGDQSGASSVTFTADSGANVTWVGGSIQLIPSPVNALGSGMILCRTSTTGYALGSVSAQPVNTSGFWDTQLALTGDLAFDSSTGTATIGRGGWYHVTVSYGGNAATPGSAMRVRAAVFQNNSLVAQGGNAESASSTTAFQGCDISTEIYCSAGDTLQAGVVVIGTGSSSVSLVGESTATLCQFKVALANRSAM